MRIRHFDDPLPGSDAKAHTTTASTLPLAARMDSCGAYRQGARYFVEREGLENALLVLSASGAGCVRAVAEDGTENAFLAGPGTAFLLDCRRPHRYSTAPEGGGRWEFAWVHFRGEFVQPFVDRFAGRPFALPRAAQDRMARRLAELMELAGSISLPADLRIAGSIHDLLCQLAEADARFAPSGSLGALGAEIGIPPVVAEAVEILRREYAEPMDIERLASRVHLSASHLSRLFRKSFGVGPYRYLSTVRINQAKSMLAIEGRSVEETARLCGFCTSSNFIREFRRIDGDTPRGFVLRRSR